MVSDVWLSCSFSDFTSRSHTSREGLSESIFYSFSVAISSPPTFSESSSNTKDSHSLSSGNGGYSDSLPPIFYSSSFSYSGTSTSRRMIPRESRTRLLSVTLSSTQPTGSSSTTWDTSDSESTRVSFYTCGLWLSRSSSISGGRFSSIS